jgi:co-chaperonin GroES (HSP10)
VKDGTKLKSLFYKVVNGRIGSLDWLTSEEANVHVVGYPEYWNIGKDKDGKDLPLKTGDRILYGGYSSDDFEIEGKKYIILEYKDVLAKLM